MAEIPRVSVHDASGNRNRSTVSGVFGRRKPTKKREAQGQSLFPSASGHLAGFLTYEAFVAPLLLVRAPWAWGLTLARGRILVMCDFGTVVSGRHRVSELLPSGASQSIYDNEPRPTVNLAQTGAGQCWWVGRLNDLFSVVTDPVLFRDSAGRYVPPDHLHLVMNIEHLFRHCSGAMSQDDSHSSRRLMFNFIDTLASVSEVDLTKLFTLDAVDKRLQTLRDEMTPEAARFLLPPANAAREALRAVQDEFVLGVDADRARISLSGPSGSEPLGLSTAAARYLKLMRNATHGFGGRSRGTTPSQLEQNRHLVAHHSGDLPENLHLLAYLHLLYFLARPTNPRARLSGLSTPKQKSGAR